MEGKSILDTVADTANAAFEHSLALAKEGKSAAAHDVASFARNLSDHAREIEDHERVMDDRHGGNISMAPEAQNEKEI